MKNRAVSVVKNRKREKFKVELVFYLPIFFFRLQDHSNKGEFEADHVPIIIFISCLLDAAALLHPKLMTMTCELLR